MGFLWGQHPHPAPSCLRVPSHEPLLDANQAAPLMLSPARGVKLEGATSLDQGWR